MKCFLKCFLLNFRNVHIAIHGVVPNNISTLEWDKSQLQKCRKYACKELFLCQCSLGVSGVSDGPCREKFVCFFSGCAVQLVGS